MPDRPALVPAPALAPLGTDDLTRALRPLWEDAAPLAVVLQGRHFGTWRDVLDAAEYEISRAPEQWRVALLRAHPRLGQDPEVLLTHSVTSWNEQGGGADPETAVRLAQLNDRYEARFGFPFVEWVAGRPLALIAEVMEDRLVADRADELARGCAASVAIARDRLSRIESKERTL